MWFSVVQEKGEGGWFVGCIFLLSIPGRIPFGKVATILLLGLNKMV
jgi:hypothetical protein